MIGIAMFPGDFLVSVIGTSGCECFGQLHSQCSVPDVPIESFPKECSSFLYVGAYIKPDLSIEDGAITNLGIEGNQIL